MKRRGLLARTAIGAIGQAATVQDVATDYAVSWNRCDPER